MQTSPSFVACQQPDAQALSKGDPGVAEAPSSTDDKTLFSKALLRSPGFDSRDDAAKHQFGSYLQSDTLARLALRKTIWVVLLQPDLF